MTLRVIMMPHPAMLKKPSGITTVVKAYDRILPEHGVEIVHPNAEADILVMHAGMGGGVQCDVAMLHGIYFTADYDASTFEYRANTHVVNSIRGARVVTVPSEWVAETLRRDFRIDPIILPHGVFVDEWKHSLEPSKKTVLWAKNRFYDVCDPTPLNSIAERMPDFQFYSTVVAHGAPSNVREIGVQPHDKMKEWIQRVSMVISTVKETWGIMYAEALAAGTPVVTTNVGHVPNLVRHGVTGYVYNERSLNDAEYGIRWTEQYRSQLSANASQLAGELDWSKQAGRIARTLKLAHGLAVANRRM